MKVYVNYANIICLYFLSLELYQFKTIYPWKGKISIQLHKYRKILHNMNSTFKSILFHQRKHNSPKKEYLARGK